MGVTDPVTILILGRVPCILPLSRVLPKSSSIMMYKKGEKRHTCLIPLDALKNPTFPPFTRGGIQGEFVQDLSQPIIILEIIALRMNEVIDPVKSI